jgi:uncharacterized protein (UPF0303 family)
MTNKEYIEIVEAQEAQLQFSRFSRRDAWELGNIFVSEIFAHNYPVTVSLRLASGFVMFQYGAEGATVNNEVWSTRKFNTLWRTESSGLLTLLRSRETGFTIDKDGMDRRDHTDIGGSFPIRLTGTGIIGAALVSGLFPFFDHDLIVECMGRFLKLDSVPRLPKDAR